jgi:hypothetical protein
MTMLKPTATKKLATHKFESVRFQFNSIHLPYVCPSSTVHVSKGIEFYPCLE